jgi:hypothetical protein
MTRTRSLKIDQNDENTLSHESNLEERKRPPNMLPMVPFFYTPSKWNVPLVDMYQGCSAFLIASGPSFKNVDKSLLASPGCWTMTLNNAVKSFRGDAACMVDDPSRFIASLWLDPKIMKFVPTSNFRKPIWDSRAFVLPDGTVKNHWGPMSNIVVSDCPNVVGFQRNEKFHAPRFLKEDTINWGNHKKWGGGRSVMLASIRILYLMGFRRVYLVGVDFEMTDTKRYHFEEGRTEASIKGNMSSYSKMVGWFNELQPLFLKEGFIVKNCNPLSNLRSFPMTTVEEAVQEATACLGDVVKERTRGMYAKHEEKMAAWQQMQQNPSMTQSQKEDLIDHTETKSRQAEMNA